MMRVFVSSTFLDMREDRDELMKRVFPQLRVLCESRGVTWGEIDLRWGITDEQAARGETLAVCLEEIERCRPFFIGLLGERYGWVPVELDEELNARESWLAEDRRRSVTELEILHGVLNDLDMEAHAFFYLRAPTYAAGRPGFVEESEEGRARLAALKQRVRESRAIVREGYSGPEELGRLVLDDLSSTINRLYPERIEPDWLTAAGEDHEAYARSRGRVYLGRTRDIQRLDEHTASDEPPLVIVGESGIGKSALLANWGVRRRARRDPAEVVLMHFVGASAASADIENMLRRLIGELDRVLALGTETPDEPTELRRAFWLALERAATHKRVVLLLDGLDQLEDRAGALELTWLPDQLPARICLIVSALPGRALDELRQRDSLTYELEPLDHTERIQLIDRYLAAYSKRLGRAQAADVAAAPQCSNPLFLRTLLDELRFAANHESLLERIDYHLTAQGVPELLEQVLDRFESDYDRDRPGLVANTMALVASARRGLAEAELLDLLGSGDTPLPSAFWAPLRMAAAELIVEHSGLLGFGHVGVRRAVEDRYLNAPEVHRDCHLHLAAYFNDDRRGYRSLDELPWQLLRAEQHDALGRLLANPRFVQAVGEHCAPGELARYWTALEAVSPHRMSEAYRDVVANPVAYGDAGDKIATLLFRAGHLDAAETIWKHVEAEAQAQDAPIEIARTKLNQGWVLADRGQFQQALAQFEAAEELFRTFEDPRPAGAALLGIGDMLLRLGRFDEALGRLRTAEGKFREAGSPFVAGAISSQAVILNTRGEYAAALSLHEEAERTLREAGQLSEVAGCLSNQGISLFAMARPADALARHTQAIDLYRELGANAEVAACLLNQGTAMRSLDDGDGAAVAFVEAEKLFAALGDGHGAAIALMNRAVLLDDAGDQRASVDLVQRAISLLRATGDVEALADALRNEANLRRQVGDLEAALKSFDEAGKLLSRLGSPKLADVELWQSRIRTALAATE